MVDPEKPKFFKQQRTHDIYYQPAPKVQGEEEADKGGVAANGKAQLSLAALLPVSKIKSLTYGQLVWSTRWTVKGLMPVKPNLILLTDLELPEGRCVEL